MTFKQRILKLLYPLLMKSKGRAKILFNEKNIKPIKSFYDLHDVRNNNAAFDFSILKGKKVLLVNTASDCGYTSQYNELEKLYEMKKDILEIIGFPSNDFGMQEKGSDKLIAKFCKMNFGISFLIMRKSNVIKSSGQNEIYKWLSDKNENGWNEQQPFWNFCKYLVDENGTLINFFGSAISPLSEEVLKVINK